MRRRGKLGFNNAISANVAMGAPIGETSGETVIAIKAIAGNTHKMRTTKSTIGKLTYCNILIFNIKAIPPICFIVKLKQKCKVKDY